MRGERHDLQVTVTNGDESARLPLRLTRIAGAGKPVLLLHGANTSADIFTTPRGGLIQFLRESDPTLDVWNLDWRGSPKVMQDIQPAPLFGHAAPERRVFTIDRVAREDLRRALDFILGERRDAGKPEQKVSVIGFCVGAGAVAHALATNIIDDTLVDRVVLMTLGLFYKTPWEGWLKTQEYLLEQTIVRCPEMRWISPFAPAPAPSKSHQAARFRLMQMLRSLYAMHSPTTVSADAWPPTLEEAFSLWSKHLPLMEPHWFSRLSFMYGEPFSQHALGSPAESERYRPLFGPLHLGLYMDAVERVRHDPLRAKARKNAPAMQTPDGQPRVYEADVAANAFSKVDVLLLGGAQNRLWHRESLDLMYELLKRKTDHERKHEKLILQDFAHLDLLWGAAARRHVYEPIYAAVC